MLQFHSCTMYMTQSRQASFNQLTGKWQCDLLSNLCWVLYQQPPFLSSMKSHSNSNSNTFQLLFHHSHVLSGPAHSTIPAKHAMFIHYRNDEAQALLGEYWNSSDHQTGGSKCSGMSSCPSCQGSSKQGNSVQSTWQLYWNSIADKSLTTGMWKFMSIQLNFAYFLDTGTKKLCLSMSIFVFLVKNYQNNKEK